MNNYEQIRLIGRGSHGSAMLVKDKSTGIKYVIKIIQFSNTKERDTADREVELLQRLSNQNVVKYIDSFYESDKMHIVMEYCEGGDLANQIKTAKKNNIFFDENQILEWFTQLCIGVHYIHSLKILHRDIKPSNIFLTKNNIVKIGDFGVSRVLDSTLQNASTVIGTPFYMSPEVCQEKPYSFSSDIWSLGCILFEMCSLSHAFDSANLLSLACKIVEDDVDYIPKQYSNELQDLVDQLLLKDPDFRYTANDILDLPFITSILFRMSEGDCTFGKDMKKSMFKKSSGKWNKSDTERKKMLEITFMDLGDISFDNFVEDKMVKVDKDVDEEGNPTAISLEPETPRNSVASTMVSVTTPTYWKLPSPRKSPTNSSKLKRNEERERERDEEVRESNKILEIGRNKEERERNEERNKVKVNSNKEEERERDEGVRESNKEKEIFRSESVTERNTQKEIVRDKEQRERNEEKNKEEDKEYRRKGKEEREEERDREIKRDYEERIRNQKDEVERKERNKMEEVERYNSNRNEERGRNKEEIQRNKDEEKERNKVTSEENKEVERGRDADVRNINKEREKERNKVNIDFNDDRERGRDEEVRVKNKEEELGRKNKEMEFNKLEEIGRDEEVRVKNKEEEIGRNNSEIQFNKLLEKERNKFKVDFNEKREKGRDEEVRESNKILEIGRNKEERERNEETNKVKVNSNKEEERERDNVVRESNKMFEIGRDKETRERNEEIEILRNENEITKNKQREIERRKSKGDEGELRQLNEEIERLRNQNQIEFNKLKEKERNEIEIFKNRQNEFLRNAAEVQYNKEKEIKRDREEREKNQGRERERVKKERMYLMNQTQNAIFMRGNLNNKEEREKEEGDDESLGGTRDFNSSREFEKEFLERSRDFGTRDFETDSDASLGGDKNIKDMNNLKELQNYIQERLKSFPKTFQSLVPKDTIIFAPISPLVDGEILANETLVVKKRRSSTNAVLE